MFKKICLIFFITSQVNSVLAFNPDSLMQAGNAYYVNNDFHNAVKAWQTVIDSGYIAAGIYYNMGNSYYKMNNYALAILNYERALLLAPANKDVKYNLELANARIIDKIDIIPEFFLKRWLDNLINLTTSNNWAIISITAFVLFLILMLVYLFSSVIFIKKMSFYLFIFSFLISVACFFFSGQRRKMVIERNSAVIVVPTVTVKSSPDEYGTNLFILHEGTKIETVDSIGLWCEIKISNGSKGWVQKSIFERI